MEAIIALILFQVYGALNGYGFDGEYWYMRKECISPYSESKLFKNPHIVWFITRMISGLAISISLFYMQWWLCIGYTIGLGATFFIWHDGMYYLRRNQLNRTLYVKRFFSMSTTSKAIMTFNLTWRIILLIFGNIICLISIKLR